MDIHSNGKTTNYLHVFHFRIHNGHEKKTRKAHFEKVAVVAVPITVRQFYDLWNIPALEFPFTICDFRMKL